MYDTVQMTLAAIAVRVNVLQQRMHEPTRLLI